MDQEIEIFESVQQQSKSKKFLNIDFDVIFEIKNDRYQVHRNLFILSSTYFFQLLSNIKFESNEIQEVIITEVIEPSAFEDIVKFIYSGKIEISCDNVYSLLIGSNILRLNDVRDACQNFLIKTLKKFSKRGNDDINKIFDNIFKIRFLAVTMTNNDLVNAADQFIAYLLDILMKKCEFLELGYLQVIALVESDFLIAKNEEVVYKACIEWAQYKGGRYIHLPQLISKVKLNLLSSQFLHGISYQLPQECQYYVNEAMNYQRSHNYPEIFEKSRSRHNNISGQIYVVGGDSLDSIEIYNPNTKTWRKEEFAKQRIGMSGSVLNGILYMFCGQTSFMNRQLATVESFNPNTKIWTQCLDALIARRNAATAVLGNCIYICGGFNGEQVLNVVEKYNTTDCSSMIISHLISCRQFHCAVTLNGCIYILGGNREAREPLNFVERFDPNLNRWEEIQPMNRTRKMFGAAVLDGKIYACGGVHRHNATNTVEVYCPNKNTWEMIASMNEIRYNFAVVSNMGKLWAIGGQSPNGKLSSVEVYDPEEKKWTFSRPMNNVRVNHFAVVIP